MPVGRLDDPADAPEDVPAAERLSDEGFYELDTRTARAAAAGARAAVRRRAACGLDRADPAPPAHRPRRLLGRRGRRPAWSGSPRRSAASDVVPGDVRRPAGPAGPRHRQAPAGGGPAPRARLPARHALGLVRPQGGAASTAQAGFDLHPQMFLTGTVDRSAIPVVEKVREGTAGDIELMDSLDRRARGAGARPGPRADAADVAAAGVRHEHRVRLRLPRRAGRLGAAGREQPAYGGAAAVGGAGRGARAGDRAARHGVRTSGRSTSGSRPGSSCTRRATSDCAG